MVEIGPLCSLRHLVSLCSLFHAQTEQVWNEKHHAVVTCPWVCLHNLASCCHALMLVLVTVFVLFSIWACCTFQMLCVLIVFYLVWLCCRTISSSLLPSYRAHELIISFSKSCYFWFLSGVTCFEWPHDNLSVACWVGFWITVCN